MLVQVTTRNILADERCLSCAPPEYSQFTIHRGKNRFDPACFSRPFRDRAKMDAELLRAEFQPSDLITQITHGTLF